VSRPTPAVADRTGPATVEMADKPRLSACVITLNEERDIAECLRSLAFCDETVVVDSGSVDHTRELAAQAGARVVIQPWLGFAAQRNVAIDHVQGRWVLEVDADERVSPALAAEIAAFVADPPPGVHLAALPRRAILVGHRLGPSTQFPTYQHRLFDPTVYRHDETVTVHEGLVPTGRVHAFTGELEHKLADSWTQFFSEVIAYARLDAAQLAAPRTLRNRLSGALIRPIAKFAWRLCVGGAWHDGLAGMAMIAGDCVYDSLVWLSPVRPARPPREMAAASGHYGSRRWPRGEPHVVAVGYGAGSHAAARWAAAAREGGLDVTLMRPGRVDRSAGHDSHSHSLIGMNVTVRPLASRSVLALLRELNAEEGVRTIDTVIPFGRWARILCRMVPGGLYGVLTPPSTPPAPAVLRESVMAARAARGQ
jgi:glycosyltransferase involved in cell wall biosynthesis